MNINKKVGYYFLRGPKLEGGTKNKTIIISCRAFNRFVRNFAYEPYLRLIVTKNKVKNGWLKIFSKKNRRKLIFLIK